MEIEIDHERAMLKYAGASKILEPFWFDCTDDSENAVHSNPKKCKELTFQKGYREELKLVHNIPQCRKMVVLGVTLKNNNKFNTHARKN